MRAKYGIDAPQLVRNFLLIGSALLAASGAAFAAALDHRPWAIWLSVLLLLPAAYSLGMLGLMLWESLVGKVKGRERVLDLLSWQGDEMVLDVGCGRGLMLVGAAHRLTAGRAIGVDLWLDRDQSSNDAAGPLENARAEGVGNRVAVETADMLDLPFAAKSFDVVVSSWAVHNLEAKADRSRALSEMVRVLRPGGAILLTDIINRNEYLAELRRLGSGDVRLVVQSAIKDWVLSSVSFGAYQPATIVARGFRAE